MGEAVRHAEAAALHGGAPPPVPVAHVSVLVVKVGAARRSTHPPSHSLICPLNSLLATHSPQ